MVRYRYGQRRESGNRSDQFQSYERPTLPVLQSVLRQCAKRVEQGRSELDRQGGCELEQNIRPAPFTNKWPTTFRTRTSLAYMTGMPVSSNCAGSESIK